MFETISEDVPGRVDLLGVFTRAALTIWIGQLAACLAYIWMIMQGLWVVANGRVGWIDRTDRQDKSVFRLGLDWLRHCLKRSEEFEPLFWFQPIPAVVNVR